MRDDRRNDRDNLGQSGAVRGGPERSGRSGTGGPGGPGGPGQTEASRQISNSGTLASVPARKPAHFRDSRLAALASRPAAPSEDVRSKSRSTALSTKIRGSKNRKKRDFFRWDGPVRPKARPAGHKARPAGQSGAVRDSLSRQNHP